MSEEKIPKFSEFARGKKHLIGEKMKLKDVLEIPIVVTGYKVDKIKWGNTMVESTIEPAELEIDKIKGGRARILCRWNIEQISRTDESSKDPHTLWQYEEAALWWTFPHSDNGNVLDNILAIDSYVQANKEEIMNFARGTQISIKEAA
jgi:hypothetical protein